MSEEEKPPKGINRRNFLRSAAAVPIAGATGGAGAINAAAVATAKLGITTAAKLKLAQYISNLGYNVTDLTSGDGLDTLRKNILGQGVWTHYKGNKKFPDKDSDGKIRFDGQITLLNNLKSMPKDQPIKVLLGDDVLKDTYEDLENPMAQRAKDLRDFLDPLCDEHTKADDLIRSFHGFFEKLAARAIKNSDDFVIYGRSKNYMKPRSVDDIKTEKNEIDSLIRILKDYEKESGIKTPNLETLEKANEAYVKKSKQRFFNEIKAQYEKIANEEREKEELDSAREQAYREDERRREQKQKEEKLAQPTKRSTANIRLEHITEDRYLIRGTGKQTTKVDWHHWALSINPFSKPHHVCLQEDGGTVVIENTAENIDVLRAVFRSNHGNGQFSAKLPNLRTGIDINQEDEQTGQPVSLPMNQVNIQMDLKVDSVVVSASEIFSGNTILGIDFSKASKLGSIDPLTGLDTIESIKAKLENKKQAIGGYQASDDNVTLIQFDISQFKLFNDIYDYETGDFLLQELSGRIKEAVGSQAIIGRTGGDKIAVIHYGARHADIDITSNIVKQLNRSMQTVVTNKNGELETIKFKAQMTQPQSAEIVNFPVSPELKVAA